MESPCCVLARLANRFLPILLSILCAATLTVCRSVPPAVEFTQVPESAPGGRAIIRQIAGRVRGAKTSQKIVLYAKSGPWYVQPYAASPFTTIEPDSTWHNATHLGTDYGALLVDADYKPLRLVKDLPETGRGVYAVASIPGVGGGHQVEPATHHVRFSGYEWDVYDIATESGGSTLANRAANVRVDSEGALHLKMVRDKGQWSCAEVSLNRSLGYGSYSLTVREHVAFESAAVLSFFTWDPFETEQNNREMDVELSQWGDPANKNAQFAIQPYYVPANVFRFSVSDRTQTHAFHWEPGRVSFRTLEQRSGGPRVTAEHVFTSGVPSPGDERIYIKLYPYGLARLQAQNDAEVIVEKFEYLP